MSKSVNSGATALCLLLFLLAPCGAQLMNTGAITGTVVDQDQTSIPGAVIEITNSETHNKAETVTNANGSFSTVGLPSGRYEVTVSGNLRPTPRPAFISVRRPSIRSMRC